jgi:hypothetical protein
VQLGDLSGQLHSSSMHDENEQGCKVQRAKCREQSSCTCVQQLDVFSCAHMRHISNDWKASLLANASVLLILKLMCMMSLTGDVSDDSRQIIMLDTLRAVTQTNRRSCIHSMPHLFPHYEYKCSQTTSHIRHSSQKTPTCFNTCLHDDFTQGGLVGHAALVLSMTHFR